jgi:periplasmic divalent cation tolerance protein
MVAMSTATHCMAITTIDGAEAAELLAQSIVEARVGACAQVVGPIKSVYWWDGFVQTAQEWQIWIKTTTAQLDALTAHIQANHSYDVPEVVATPIIGGNPAYLEWVTNETQLR